ncbi:Uma2 family endonuclease [Gemmata sp. JC673]|uniref:Uma2 family endonuclease n=1 Tax=Gemmata algarum TaxID=2975278 RepID=A0ABU5FAQ1_9BACT|nr:Uma2 family endonuclease [Gemmata algarum]MDY3562919.1 Uma2 family endonuclease [Gemmata algarum]
MSTKPPPTAARTFRFNREQYHRLGALGFFGGKRVELIRGEIVEMSPINWPHQLGKIKLTRALEAALAGIGWINEQGPLAIGDSEPQPDVAVIAGRPEDYTYHPRTALLVAEISHTTLPEDNTTKAELYATAGIADYWVLDVVGRELHVFRDPRPLPAGLGATAYHTHHVFGPTDRTSPLAAPGATILVADLLP